jgi:NADH-quinone oxidoreductase subunit K
MFIFWIILHLIFFSFLISVSGVFLTRKNFITILMCIELMLMTINFSFVFFSVHLDDMAGQFFTLFILAVAAAESALGLAIVVVFYRLSGVISIDLISYIKA